MAHLGDQRAALVTSLGTRVPNGWNTSSYSPHLAWKQLLHELSGSPQTMLSLIFSLFYGIFLKHVALACFKRIAYRVEHCKASAQGKGPRKQVPAPSSLLLAT